jgi:hypothetical protein
MRHRGEHVSVQFDLTHCIFLRMQTHPLCRRECFWNILLGMAWVTVKNHGLIVSGWVIDSFLLPFVFCGWISLNLTLSYSFQISRLIWVIFLSGPCFDVRRPLKLIHQPKFNFDKEYQARPPLEDEKFACRLFEAFRPDFEEFVSCLQHDCLPN